MREYSQDDSSLLSRPLLLLQPLILRETTGATDPEDRRDRCDSAINCVDFKREPMMPEPMRVVIRVNLKAIRPPVEETDAAAATKTFMV